LRRRGGRGDQDSQQNRQYHRSEKPRMCVHKRGLARIVPSARLHFND
jgi:hypothetical protein